MPRDLPVGNGNLLLNFDLDYRIRDIYFPWVGQENHTRGEEFRFGIWVDGQFSWMGDEWQRDLRYCNDSLVTDVHLRNDSLGLALWCQDAVDSELNVFIRIIDITDTTGRDRVVRLFFSHNFYLYGHEIGDTAYFDPRTQALIHYKQSRYFLANCRSATGGEMLFTCGPKGAAETWKDAEDGELRAIPIAWGHADSIVGTQVLVPAGGTERGTYWLAAGTRYDEVADLNRKVIVHSPEALLARTSNYWQGWVRKEARNYADLPETVSDIFNRSLLILRSQVDNRGGIIAANDSDIVRFGGDTYSYVWGRDGAFVAAALANAGYAELCRNFFLFCRRALANEGYLFQHYNPDGSLASNWHPWIVDGVEVLPIQEDSTALLLWSLWISYEETRDIEFVRPLYESFIVRCADFLLAYRDEETRLPTSSYDLWEERYGVHAYTVATVVAGLRAAARFAAVYQDDERVKRYSAAADEMASAAGNLLYDDGLGRFARSGYRVTDGYILDQVIDVSLLGLATLGAIDYDDPRMVATAEAIRNELTCHSAAGGLARYSNDQYQREEDVAADVPGNPWFIATLWLAEYDIERATTLDQLRLMVSRLEWCADNALPSGVLAEQVHPTTGHPLSVSPLTWSHSAFVGVVLAYLKKHRQLTYHSILDS